MRVSSRWLGRAAYAIGRRAATAALTATYGAGCMRQFFETVEGEDIPQTDVLGINRRNNELCRKPNRCWQTSTVHHRTPLPHCYLGFLAGGRAPPRDRHHAACTESCRDLRRPGRKVPGSRWENPLDQARISTMYRTRLGAMDFLRSGCPWHWCLARRLVIPLNAERPAKKSCDQPINGDSLDSFNKSESYPWPPACPREESLSQKVGGEKGRRGGAQIEVGGSYPQSQGGRRTCRYGEGGVRATWRGTCPAEKASPQPAG
jgi:hypothetical protein